MKVELINSKYLGIITDNYLKKYDDGSTNKLQFLLLIEVKFSVDNKCKCIIPMSYFLNNKKRYEGYIDIVKEYDFERPLNLTIGMFDEILGNLKEIGHNVIVNFILTGNNI
jgi:hypothetical protein